MRTDSHLVLADPAPPRDDAAAPSAHLAEADRLISDLTALVDAGVLVVHEHVLGPARYGLAPGPDRVDRVDRVA